MSYPTLTGVGAERLKLSDDRVVVAGAGGWLGLATLEALHQLLGEAFHRRVLAFGSADRTLMLRGGLVVEQAALVRLTELVPAPSLVLHLAFLTQEKAKAMSEADYVAANRAISGTVLGALDRIGARGVFVASSGAAYLASDPGAEASKRLYGRLKLEDEAHFAAWARGRRARAVIARIFNVSGPYVNKQSSYALACFIADALAGRPISIQATRPVLRSYVAINELMSVAIGLMTVDGDSPIVTFDTAGNETLEMADIARTVLGQIGARGGVTRAEMRSDGADSYLGDGALYRAFCDRLGVQRVDFDGQVVQTASFMMSKERGDQAPHG